MLHPRATCCLLLATLALSAAGAAWAQQGRGDRGGPPPPPRADRADRADRGPPARDVARSRDSLSDSVRRVQRDTRGQVLSAERVPFDGREMHRVKVLDDRGRVRVYMDDPRRGPPRERTRGDDD